MGRRILFFCTARTQTAPDKLSDVGDGNCSRRASSIGSGGKLHARPLIPCCGNGVGGPVRIAGYRPRVCARLQQVRRKHLLGIPRTCSAQPETVENALREIEAGGCGASLSMRRRQQNRNFPICSVMWKWPSSSPLRRIKQPLMLENGVSIGHPRDVVGNSPGASGDTQFALENRRGFLVLGRHQGRVIDKGIK
jgi:hypothetical protein